MTTIAAQLSILNQELSCTTKGTNVVQDGGYYDAA